MSHILICIVECVWLILLFFKLYPFGSKVKTAMATFEIYISWTLQLLYLHLTVPIVYMYFFSWVVIKICKNCRSAAIKQSKLYIFYLKPKNQLDTVQSYYIHILGLYCMVVEGNNLFFSIVLPACIYPTALAYDLHDPEQSVHSLNAKRSLRH